MPGNFNENTRVQVPAALHLCRLGYTYLDNICDPEPHTNILQDVFKRAVVRLNPDKTESDAASLLSKLVNVAGNDDLGREFYRLLTANSGFKLIDFDNPDNNEWHVTTELTCEDPESREQFRPDVTCFVNGLPLAFIEVKIPNNHDGILAERGRINWRMSNKHFRSFFNVTQLMVFSNNQEYERENRVPIQGAFYCCAAKEKAFFNVFREEGEAFVRDYPYQNVDEQTEAKVLRHRNCVAIMGNTEYATNRSVSTPTNRILTSLLSKERFLFLLRYGFAYVDRKVELPNGTQDTELQKQVMRYQQMFALQAIVRTLRKGLKSGIIWHTQGSGKTALAFFSVKCLTDYFSKQKVVAKFYFIVDRIDLMEQASDEFAARGLDVHNAQSREELMQDIASTATTRNPEGKPDIMVVNIQKFRDDSKEVKVNDDYNTQIQRIFFVDEAHRGYQLGGCFLANLMEADKKAVKIALTGTPLLKEERETWRVFGDYIHKYFYDKSIADGYTCRLMREPVETSYKEKMQDILNKLAGGVKVKRADIDRDKIIEHESYLSALLDYIISDFLRFRLEQNDPQVGAMIVCKTNQQARTLYKLWQAEKEVQLGLAAEPMAVYFGGKRLTAALILHDEGDKQERKAYIDDFKKPPHKVDVLIVNKMLLTGFDSPRLKKLYLGRSLEGHDLLQALTRVNRPYRDFKYGYVVDFVDIKENFDEANERYMQELNKTSLDGQAGDIGANILVSREEVEQKIAEIKAVLFNYTTDNMEEFRKEIDEIDDKSILYELRNILSEAKALINQARSFGDEETLVKLESLPLGGISTMISEVTRCIEKINLIRSTDHEADVSGIINLVMSELEFEFRKGMHEELRIVLGDVRECAMLVQAEFEANFDHDDEQYANLAEEFRLYFRNHGFTPRSVAEANESKSYLEEVMKKIKEINRRNNVLKGKYGKDEKFVRIHKRIEEQNRDRQRPIISALEYELAENLSKIKEEIDGQLFFNINLLDNEESFKYNVMSIISRNLWKMKVNAPAEDRLYIRNLIANEYLRQRQGI